MYRLSPAQQCRNPPLSGASESRLLESHCDFVPRKGKISGLRSVLRSHSMGPQVHGWARSLQYPIRASARDYKKARFAAVGVVFVGEESYKSASIAIFSFGRYAINMPSTCASGCT